MLTIIVQCNKRMHAEIVSEINALRIEYDTKPIYKDILILTCNTSEDAVKLGRTSELAGRAVVIITTDTKWVYTEGSRGLGVAVLGAVTKLNIFYELGYLVEKYGMKKKSFFSQMQKRRRLIFSAVCTPHQETYFSFTISSSITTGSFPSGNSTL